MSEKNAVPGTESQTSQEEIALPTDAKPFYGWWIIAAATSVLFVSSGIGFYGHGVILDPMRTFHGWSKATISSAVTLYFVTSGIMGMMIGRQVDRYGPKMVYALLLTIASLACFQFALAQSFREFLFARLIMGMVGAGFVGDTGH